MHKEFLSANINMQKIWLLCLALVIQMQPLEVNVKYSWEDGELLTDPLIYRQLVGSLVYLTITRLDISYAVNVVGQFMSAVCTKT